VASTTCGWCDRLANMTAVADASELRGTTSMYQVTAMRPYRCDYCRGISVAVMAGDASGASSLEAWFEENDRALTWRPRKVAGKNYPDVPEHIGHTASEAHEVASIDALRAAVVLARAVIEATAKEREVFDGRLYDKIETLFKQGLIREHVRDAAHEIRHLGNDMAHGDFVADVHAEEAEELLVLMDEVLHEVYRSPARVRRRREARLARNEGGDG